MAEFSPTQGRYLAFIHAYIELHGYPPAESEIGAAMCVSAPSVNQMVKTLEKKGLILRRPGVARSIRILIPEEEIPSWNQRRSTKAKTPSKRTNRDPKPAPTLVTNLYVLKIILIQGPVSKKFANQYVYRTIEIRGDQTLAKLHQAIFDAFDREVDVAYEFQCGQRAFDPAGPDYGLDDPATKPANYGDAQTTTLDDLGLTLHRVFGYVFNLEVVWFHDIQVEKVESAIPTVTYPRLIRKAGKSPPQFCESSS